MTFPRSLTSCRRVQRTQILLLLLRRCIAILLIGVADAWPGGQRNIQLQAASRGDALVMGALVMGVSALFIGYYGPFSSSTKQDEKRMSPFDKFMSWHLSPWYFWLGKKGRRRKLEHLAAKLCERSASFVLRATSSSRLPTGDDEDRSGTNTPCRVSWNGLTPRWFKEVFMETPEVQEMVAFGCPMWYLREYCILEILHRRGITEGPAIDALYVFGNPLRGATITNWFTKRSKTNKASVFISFTGSYTIQHFAEMMQHEAIRDEHLWIDTFCVDQFAWTRRKDDKMQSFKRNFMEELSQKIKGIGRAALVLEQWDTAKEIIQKIWVVWEIYSAAKGPVPLDILLSPDAERAMVDNVFGGRIKNVTAVTSKIDAATSYSHNKEDELLIHEAMRQDGGFHKVNANVIQKLNEWITMAATEAFKEKRAKQKAMDPDTLKSMGNLASTLWQLGKLEDAEAMQRQCLLLSKEVLGDRHPHTLTSMNNLANTLWQLGKLEDAEAMQRQCLLLSKEVLGDRHPHTLTSMNNLASTLKQLGKLEDAEAMQRQCLLLRMEVLGDRHPDMLQSMNNLASTLKQLGNLEDAEAMQRQCLLLRMEVLGDRHPHTLTSMNNLANTLWQLGKLEDAEAMQRQCLLLRMEVLGDRHPDMLQSMNNLASTLKQLGKLDDAEAMQRQCLLLSQEVLGDRHPHTLTSMNNLANTLWQLGKLGDAEAMQRQCLLLSKEVLGDRHPDTLTSMGNLANTLWQLGKLEDAEAMQRQCLLLSKEVLGDRYPDTLTSMGDLATTLWQLGKLEDAEAMQRQCLLLSKEVLGDRHPHTLTSMGDLATFLWQLGKLEDAEAMQRQCLLLRKEVLGDRHPDTLKSMGNLSFMLAERAKLKDFEIE